MVNWEDDIGRLQKFSQTRGFSAASLNDEVTKKLDVMLELGAEGASHGSCAAALRLGQEGEVHGDVGVDSHTREVLDRRVLLCHCSLKRKQERELIEHTRNRRNSSKGFKSSRWKDEAKPWILEDKTDVGSACRLFLTNSICFHLN